MKLIFLICTLVLSFQSISQSCDRVWLKGKVVDTLNRQTFLNLMVVNMNTGLGVFGQPDGTFAVYVNPNDSIVLSIKGYDRIGFRVVPDSLCQFVCLYGTAPKPKEIAEVIIRPLKTVQQIKEERASLALRETRTITGIEAIQSPITALYQRFSKKEQSKARVAELQYEDSKVAIVQELLRLYVSYDVIQLSSNEFEDFIAFMSINEDFLKTASDIELISFIQDKLEHYLLLHPQAKD